MKTLFIFNQYGDGVKYFVVPGNYSHFEGVVINSDPISKGWDLERYRTLHDLLLEFLYDDEANFRFESIVLDKFPTHLLVDDVLAGKEIFVVSCGEMP